MDLVEQKRLTKLKQTNTRRCRFGLLYNFIFGGGSPDSNGLHPLTLNLKT